MSSMVANSGHSYIGYTRSISPYSTYRSSVSSDATVRGRGSSTTKSINDSGHGHGPLEKACPPIRIHPPSTTLAPINTYITSPISDSPLTDSPPQTPNYPPYHHHHQHLHRSPPNDVPGSAPPTAASEHRWSDIVPPQTALTFAAVYDPSEGLITFSGAELLPSSSSSSSSCSSSSLSPSCSRSPTPATIGHVPYNSSRAPSLLNSFPPFPSDGQSQVLTIDRIGSVFGVGGNGMITPALSTAQFTTSDGMADMKSMLETYFRSGTKQQLLAEQYLRPMGSGESNARASSALEGPICEALTNMNRHVRVRTGADGDEGQCERDGDDMFTWSWLDRLGDQLILNPSFDARPYGEEENRRVDSGYAREEEENLASQRQTLDSARRAQINRLRGARRQDLQKGFTLEELMQEDDGEPIDPNEFSRFSVTTTSTSDYVDVGLPISPSCCSDWSTLEAPDHGSYTDFTLQHHHTQACNTRATHALHATNTNTLPRNRLQKKKCVDTPSSTRPAKPEEVLARIEYNHESPILPCSSLYEKYRTLPTHPSPLRPKERPLPKRPRTPPPPPPSSFHRPGTAQSSPSSGKSGKTCKSAPAGPVRSASALAYTSPTSSPSKPKSTAPNLCRFTRSNSSPEVTVSHSRSQSHPPVHTRWGSTDSGQEKPKSIQTITRKKSVIEKLGSIKRELVGTKVPRDEMWVCVDVRCEVTQRDVAVKN